MVTGLHEGKMLSGDFRPDKIVTTQHIMTFWLYVYIYIHPSVPPDTKQDIPDLDGPSLQYATRIAPNTSQGLHNVYRQDLKLLNLTAFTRLAEMFNRIEGGAAWPDQCLYARSAYLTKPKGDPLIPEGYRVLAILSVIYRLWAASRLQSLQPWVKHWALDGTCAGIPGVGADDGWYCSAIEMEHAKLLGIPFLGATVDIGNVLTKSCVHFYTGLLLRQACLKECSRHTQVSWKT